jgi:hypothetical protein
MISRNVFIKNNLLLIAGSLFLPNLVKSNPLKLMDNEKLDPELVKEFVGNCHGNLPRVKELYEQQPRLIFASHDWAAGDFENGIEAAGHTGHKDIAAFLLEKGTRINFFTMCMLGHTDAVKSILQNFPAMAFAKGPHGFTPLHHAIQGGEAAADIRKMLEAAGAKEDKILL